MQGILHPPSRCSTRAPRSSPRPIVHASLIYFPSPTYSAVVGISRQTDSRKQQDYTCANLYSVTIKRCHHVTPKNNRSTHQGSEGLQKVRQGFPVLSAPASPLFPGAAPSFTSKDLTPKELSEYRYSTAPSSSSRFPSLSPFHNGPSLAPLPFLSSLFSLILSILS